MLLTVLKFKRESECRWLLPLSCVRKRSVDSEFLVSPNFLVSPPAVVGLRHDVQEQILRSETLRSRDGLQPPRLRLLHPPQPDRRQGLDGRLGLLTGKGYHVERHSVIADRFTASPLADGFELSTLSFLNLLK